MFNNEFNPYDEIQKHELLISALRSDLFVLVEAINNQATQLDELCKLIQEMKDG